MEPDSNTCFTKGTFPDQIAALRIDPVSKSIYYDYDYGRRFNF